MKQEETIDFHIRRAWHGLARHYNQEAEKYGGTMSIGYVLLSIDKGNGTPSTQLGPKMGMERTSLTRTLKIMEDKGLISRRQGKTDSRIVRICLTDEGLAMRKIARKTVIDCNTRLQDAVSDDKLSVFMEVMVSLNEAIGLLKQNRTTTDTSRSE